MLSSSQLLQQHQQQQSRFQQAHLSHQTPFQHLSSYPLDFDFDFDFDCPPESTQAFAPSPNDSTHSSIDESLPFQLSTELMQSEAWGGLAQQTPRLARFAHQRDSSLSSLASSAAGPSSPFAPNTSNPQIAVTDSAYDGLSDHGLATGNAHSANSAQNSYYQLAKSMAPYNNGYQSCGLEAAIPEMAYPIAITGPSGKPRIDRSLMSAPDFTNGTTTRSHPASVASSIAGDSPATPTVGYGNPPKLDRTMTDVYGDELYSPNFAITSTPPPQQQHLAVSPSNEVFNQRLNAANNQHLGTVHSPASSTSRDRSPFRAGSPHGLSPNHNFVTSSLASTMPFNSAQRVRDQSKAQQDAQYLQPQMMQPKPEPETPKTISPKDAVLEFHETDDSNFPLFPTQEPSAFEMDQFSKAIGSQNSHDDPQLQDSGAGGAFNYIPSQLPASISVPQQYPFVAHPRASHDTPPRLSSTGSSSAESRTNTPAHRPRPGQTLAEGGTYTCTYHGCTLRFETPALLQKHKREGHRQTQPLGGPRPREMGGMTSSLLNSQAGPHKCDRINPSTGKPCNTIFSRPYDLTRHEDTIHNARKQKVRCNLCAEEKTFSRADALTRHYRVCHPDVELPGKHRRRGLA